LAIIKRKLFEMCGMYGITFEELDKLALSRTDNEAARMMQEAKDKLFRKALKEEA